MDRNNDIEDQLWKSWIVYYMVLRPFVEKRIPATSHPHNTRFQMHFHLYHTYEIVIFLSFGM